ncbi:hypothetical protein A5643_12830 [Mycobacterium sp. 1274756.6]|nr:hypothetical protein A5643_12830 [Mycobacterium sp. 1274756.6]
MVEALMAHNPELMPEVAVQFVGIAANSYCPDQLSPDDQVAPDDQPAPESQLSPPPGQPEA